MRGVLLCLSLGGCAYKVPVSVDPSGGLVEMDGAAVPAPTEVRVAPFRPVDLRITAQGQRALVVRIRWNALTMLKASRAQEYRLVDEHGAAGTWTR